MSDQKELTPDSTSIPLMSSTDDNESDDDSHDQPQSSKKSSGRRHKWKVVLEAVALIFFLLFLWAVYAAVPTVFYVLKPILQVHQSCCLSHCYR